MLKKINIALLLSILVNCAFAQPVKLRPDQLKEIRLAKILKWKIDTDSTGRHKDSTLTVYIYDTLHGRLAEKRYAYTQNFSKYDASVKYMYNIKGFLVDSVAYDNTAIRGGSQLGDLDSSMLILYDHNRIMSVTKKWKGGSEEILRYSYGILISKNQKKYFFFATVYDYALFPGYFSSVQSECRGCKKNKRGDIYSADGVINLPASIEIYHNGKSDQLIRFEYDFGTSLKTF